jgi:peptidoglycan hydrolase-like protein with peptidoglycan-binding domain
MAKNITGSVGRGGRNYPPSDVMTVQYLLNCVPALQGGPSPELAVDGAAGPKTIAAIEKFQRAKSGACDGRVDPWGATLRALQERDPYPNQALGPAAAKGTPFGKSGSASAYGKDPFAKDAYGKGGSATAYGKDPFAKDAYGKGGSATAYGKDPFAKDGGSKGGSASAGRKDPFGWKGF